MIWQCSECFQHNHDPGTDRVTCPRCGTAFDRVRLPIPDLARKAINAMTERPKSLTLWHIIQQQVARSNRWHPGGITDWSALEWAGAMAGEAGEACNAARKLKRIDDKCLNINNEPGRSLTTRDAARDAIGKEVADTILYAITLCAREEIDLEVHLVERFNTKSEEYGFPERL